MDILAYGNNARIGLSRLRILECHIRANDHYPWYLLTTTLRLKPTLDGIKLLSATPPGPPSQCDAHTDSICQS